MTSLDERISLTLNALELTGGPLGIRTLLRDIQTDRTPEPLHPLKPRGDAHRDRLVAARINLRAAESQHA